MKKEHFLTAVLLLFALPFAITYAQGNNSSAGSGNNQGAQAAQAIHEEGTGLVSPETREAVHQDEENQNKGNAENPIKDQIRPDEPDQDRIQAKTSAPDHSGKAGTTSELAEMVQTRTQELAQEEDGLGEKERDTLQHQNEVRVATHTLLSAENLLGENGGPISQIAREFDNSVEKTIRAENSIQTRSAAVNFFFGGDEESANAIEEEVGLNRERIQELNRLIEDCDCDDEVKVMLKNQVQNMEQEQERLEDLANEQQERRGIFGFLFGWLK